MNTSLGLQIRIRDWPNLSLIEYGLRQVIFFFIYISISVYLSFQYLFIILSIYLNNSITDNIFHAIYMILSNGIYCFSFHLSVFLIIYYKRSIALTSTIQVFLEWKTHLYICIYFDPYLGSFSVHWKIKQVVFKNYSKYINHKN